MAATAVEGWHSVSLSLVWFTGVAFTYDYCHNGRYWSGGVAFSVTIIGAVYRCGIYLWLHCRNGSYSTGDVALCVTNIGVVYRCGVYLGEHQVSQWQLQQWRGSFPHH